MAVNSSEYFKEYAKQLGLPDAVIASMSNPTRNWGTLGQLAHAASDVSQFDSQVLRPILGGLDGAQPDGIDHPQAASLRRLHFEAHQMTMMNL